VLPSTGLYRSYSPPHRFGHHPTRLIFSAISRILTSFFLPFFTRIVYGSPLRRVFGLDGLFIFFVYFPMEFSPFLAFFHERSFVLFRDAPEASRPSRFIISCGGGLGFLLFIPDPPPSPFFRLSSATLAFRCAHPAVANTPLLVSFRLTSIVARRQPFLFFFGF